LWISAQGQHEPEAGGKEEGVNQLVDLRPHLTITLQHGLMQVKRTITVTNFMHGAIGLHQRGVAFADLGGN